MIVVNRHHLTNILRYVRPRNIQIYQNVFIHRSALKKIQKQCDTHVPDSNERLEFLGDAVINIVVTDYLYNRFPNKNEGFLTKIRIKLVKGSTLCSFARYLDIERFLVISHSTSSKNDNILENAFEALVGALYLDYNEVGLALYYTKRFLYALFEEYVNMDELIDNDDNYKDILMRYTQKNHIPLPIYTVTDIQGKAHNPVYIIKTCITDKQNNMYTSVHEGKTKRDAEQLCARDIMEQIKKQK